MARRFSLGRFGKALDKFGQSLGKIFAPSRAPAPAPEPARPPAREPERQQRDPYRAEWNRQRGQGSYRKNLRAFHNVVDTVESDPAEQAELWKSYVRHINRGKGPFRRNSSQNMFWRDSGIDPKDFDWKTWREAMGFVGKRRSRTP